MVADAIAACLGEGCVGHLVHADAALLAALAQAEGAGNPVASTYWRWRLTRNPFASYQPASHT